VNRKLCMVRLAVPEVASGKAIASPNAVVRINLPLAIYLSPGHHVEGGSLAEIFVARSATRWLRL
jgi:hypothetical protein